MNASGKMEYRTGNAAAWLLAGVIILKFVGHYFAIDPAFDLQRDEYLHLDQANHLALGYQSVPPFTSWISLLIKLLGNGVFWVKFFPALFGAGTIVAAYKITETIGGGLYAKALTAVALLCSLLFRINILFQPNSFDILAWTLLYLFLVKYIKEPSLKWLLWMACIFAAGFLNKYNILFLMLAVATALIATKERKIFIQKSLYIAAALALILIIPNLVWQYEQGFPIIYHMHKLAVTQLVHVKRIDFLKTQLIFFVQAIFMILAAFIGFIIYKPFKKYRAIIWSYIFCILLFVYFRAKAYYAIGLYPVLIAFGAVYLQHLLINKKFSFLKALSFVFIVAGFYPYFIRMPVLPPEKLQNVSPFNSTGPHRWEDGNNYPIEQDFADMLGWRELAHKTDSIYNSLPANENTIIITDNYGQAGAINFYTSLKAVSFNADYINWFKLDKPIENLILVKEAGGEDAGIEKEIMYFENGYAADSITNQFARERGTHIFVLRHAKVNVNDTLAAQIAYEKKLMRFF